MYVNYYIITVQYLTVNYLMWETTVQKVEPDVESVREL